MMIIHHEDMIGSIFLTEQLKSGEIKWASIVKSIEDHDTSTNHNQVLTTFLFSFNDD